MSSQLACLQVTHPHPQAGRGGRPGDGVAPRGALPGLPAVMLSRCCWWRQPGSASCRLYPSPLCPCISTGLPGATLGPGQMLWPPLGHKANSISKSSTLNSLQSDTKFLLIGLLVQLKSQGNTLLPSYVETFFFVHCSKTFTHFCNLSLTSVSTTILYILQHSLIREIEKNKIKTHSKKS